MEWSRDVCVAAYAYCSTGRVQVLYDRGAMLFDLSTRMTLARRDPISPRSMSCVIAIMISVPRVRLHATVRCEDPSVAS